LELFEEMGGPVLVASYGGSLNSSAN